MNPSYDSPFGSQNPGGQTEMPGGMFPNDQMPNNQMLNNQMSASNGYFPNQPMVSSSSQGDIILNPGKPNRKLPVILAIVVALIAIVAVVVMLIINLNRPSASPTGVSTDAKAAFSRFANFITTGTEGDTFPTEEYDSSTYYSLNNAIDDQDDSYLAKANQLFEEFANQIVNSADGDIKEQIDDYKTDWLIIYTHAKNRLYDDAEFEEQFITKGSDSIKSQIETEYQELKSINSYEADVYAEAFLAYEKSLFDRFNVFLQSGCRKNEQIDYVCAREIPLSEEQLTKIKEEKANSDEYSLAINSMTNYFIQDLWDIARDLNDD